MTSTVPPNHGRSIEDASPEARLAAAVAALEQSRERMVSVVAPKKAKPRGPGPSSSEPAAASPSAGTARPPSTLRAMASAAAAVLRGWWRHHPLRQTLEEVEGTGKALIGPHVSKHPALAIAGAAGVGAALVLVLPRRGWALALPWLGMEVRNLVRTFWRSWYARPPAR